MTIKNIPLLCLSIVVLSATYPGSSVPVPEDAITKPSFEPPREMLLVVNDAENPAASAPAPTQAIAEKLAHTNLGTLPGSDTTPDDSQPPQSSQPPAEVEVESTPAQDPPTAASAPSTDIDDKVVQPADTPDSAIVSLNNVQPTAVTPPDDATAPTAAPAEAPDSVIEDLPTTVLTMTPTFQPTTIPAAQFYSISTNPYATFTSVRLSPSSTKPSVPLPSQGPPSESEVAKRSRRTAVVGSLVAVGIITSLVAFICCFRCRDYCRKKNMNPLDLLADDHERESLSAADEKEETMDISSPTIGVPLPILRSHNSHAVAFADPPDQQEWRVVAATHDGHVEDVTHVVTDDFMEVDLSSQANLFVAGVSTDEDTAVLTPSTPRTSAGAVSTAAQSYSTRASVYSRPSSTESTQAVRSSASFDKLNQLASLAIADICTPSSSSPRTPGRKRSKTETSAPPPLLSPLKASKSLPSIAAYENRFSNESTRTRKTAASGDSEWDVAQAYGARFSKESAAGASILSTISEATVESVEAVEVGGKKCVLMKGKF